MKPLTPLLYLRSERIKRSFMRSFTLPKGELRSLLFYMF